MNEEEKEAVEDIKRELSDEDRKEYMSSWFAKDLDIAVNLIEKLQKENEELKEKWNRDCYKIDEMIKEESKIKTDYVSVQKIKDKIEDLKKEGNYRTIDNPSGRVHFRAEGCDYKIQVLQELLEEGEKN